MTNNSRYIKIPLGGIKAANELGILKDVEFFYQLKVINEEGFFRKNHIVHEVQKRYKFAQSSIWRKLKRLQKLGLVRKNRTGYRLVSYNTLFEILKFDMTYNYCRKRKGKFRILKLGLNKIDQMILYVAKDEIEANLNKQAYVVYRRIRKQDRFKELLRKERTQSIIETINALYNTIDKVEYQKEIENSREIEKFAELNAKRDYDETLPNLDITLSTGGVARLLGFQASSKGHQILKSLNDLNLVQSLKRELYLGTTSLNYMQFRRRFKHTAYRLVDSCIYRTLPNKLVIL